MILNANALQLPLADNSVQCVVTSPPYYGLRDYGIDGQIGLEPSPEQYTANLVAVFREVRRVLREDGTCWVNLGDSYAGSNQTGGTNSKEIGKREDRMFDVVKSKRNASRWGGGNLPATDGLKPKDLIGIPWRVAFALQADGWWLRSDIIWHKSNPMPESVTDRPTKAHEYLFLLTKSARYYFDQDAVREESLTPSDSKSSPRFGAPGGKVEMTPGKKHVESGEEWVNNGRRNIRSVWTIATQPTPYAHFATFPEKLVEPCIKAGSKQGDIVFDPFMGSGTVERVAIRLRRHAIGTELNYKYIREIASIRTSNIQPVMLEVQP